MFLCTYAYTHTLPFSIFSPSIEHAGMIKTYGSLKNVNNLLKSNGCHENDQVELVNFLWIELFLKQFPRYSLMGKRTCIYLVGAIVLYLTWLIPVVNKKDKKGDRKCDYIYLIFPVSSLRLQTLITTCHESRCNCTTDPTNKLNLGTRKSNKYKNRNNGMK